MARQRYEPDVKYVNIANPGEVPIHPDDLRDYTLWMYVIPAGYEGINFAVWADYYERDDGLDILGEALLEKAPGLITPHGEHQANLIEAFNDAGLEVEDEIPWDDDGYRQIVEEAEAGLIHTESGYIDSGIRSYDLHPFERLQLVLRELSRRGEEIPVQVDDAESAAVAIDWLEETGYGAPKPDLYAKVWKKSVDEHIGMRRAAGSHVDQDELEAMNLIAFAFGLGEQWVGLSGEWDYGQEGIHEDEDEEE